MAREIWQFGDDININPAVQKEMTETLGISEFLLKLLCRRGITTVEAAQRFLFPEKYQPLHSPQLLPDMEKAVRRITTAIEKKEKITVYGDYDVDGITATAILVNALNRLGAVDVAYYIPDRFKEGYGLNEDALKKISADGTKLLITVDCGIASDELIRSCAATLGFDIVITDHHLPAADAHGWEVIPRGEKIAAVVNPHCHHGVSFSGEKARTDYPFPEICGAVVAFKLAEALTQEIAPESIGADGYEFDMEFAALATFADVMPLIDENRRIAKRGLEIISRTQNVGLKALLKAAALKQLDENDAESGYVVTASNVGFSLAPLLNSAGRMTHAKLALELLLTNDTATAAHLAGQLAALNNERKRLTQEVFNAADAQFIANTISAGKTVDEQDIIVVCGRDWNKGVIGLVAGRLTEKYHRPSVVLTLGASPDGIFADETPTDFENDEAIAKGSARSVDGFPIYDALAAPSVSQHILHFGGHAMAAGLSLQADKLADFTAALAAYAAENLTDEMKTAKIPLECVLNPADADASFLDDIARLEPTGNANNPPQFAMLDACTSSARTMGNDGSHLMFYLAAENAPARRTRAVFWRGCGYLPLVSRCRVDIAYELSVNHWQGRTYLECVAHFLRPAKSSFTPEKLRATYKNLREYAKSCDDEIFFADDAAAKNMELCREELAVIIDIFSELGFILANGTDEAGRLRYAFAKDTPKRSLTDSFTYNLIHYN